MGVHYSAHSLFSVKVKADEWLDENDPSRLTVEKYQLLQGTPLVYLAASPYYDCPWTESVVLVGMSVDGLDGRSLAAAIQSAPVALISIGVKGKPRMQTVLDVR